MYALYGFLYLIRTLLKMCFPAERSTGRSSRATSTGCFQTKPSSTIRSLIREGRVATPFFLAFKLIVRPFDFGG
jgi:hypothetical protein